MRASLLPLILSPLLAFANDAVPAFNPSIERLDPAFDLLVAPEAQVEKLADGFTWSEGPLWYRGSVLFSDVPENVIYCWSPGDTRAAVFLKHSGLLQAHQGAYAQGSNGLGLDANGRLLICQHGERRIARLEQSGQQTPIADHFEGKRFNSPNDLAVRKNRDIYFTDPPYGLTGLDESPLKELDSNGVYRVTPEGIVSLLIGNLSFPNGLAFSPDEKILYVSVSDSTAPRIMAYEVAQDGSLAHGHVFFNAQALQNVESKGLPDGVKVDARGNVFATGPGGVLVISKDGKHLGSILTGQPTSNCCWGDDGSTLYITANMFLCRLKTSTKGAGF